LKSLLGRPNLKNLVTRVYLIQKSITRFIKERRTIKALHLFRNYSALFVVASSAVLVSATNLAAGKESSGFLFGYFGETENHSNPVENNMSLKADKKSDLALVKLAQASTAPEPTLPTAAPVEEEIITTEGQALIARNNQVQKAPAKEGGVVIYEVKEGDTIGAIATNNNITINTILWANEIDDIDSIMPGDKIFILPVSGMNYTIKKSDTLDSIAKKYKADKKQIMAFNNLPANEEIKEGETIVIPGGIKETPQPASTTGRIATRPYESFEEFSGKKLDGKAGTGRSFPYGYCTWYVAKKRYIPWSGNAGTWLYKAKSMGYATGKKPKVGSIMVTTENAYYGHVAYVEKVNENMITVSEMNFIDFAKISRRTLDARSRVIKGFIY